MIWALEVLERFLLPNACVVCSATVETSAPDALVCAVCRSRLRPLPLGCLRCRHPMPPVGPCRFCAAWPEVLRWAASAVWLGDEARAIAHHLKYRGYTRLAELVAGVIVRSVRRPERAVLVPVPLGRGRRRVRGYNQAACLADALGRLWDLPVDRGVVRRVRDGTSQTGLTPEQRVANVAGAFEADRRPRPHDDSGSIILVDDVLTTGATLAAAAAALGQSGWDHVGGVTFARALPFDIRAVWEMSPRRARTSASSNTSHSRPA